MYSLPSANEEHARGMNIIAVDSDSVVGRMSSTDNSIALFDSPRNVDRGVELIPHDLCEFRQPRRPVYVRLDRNYTQVAQYDSRSAALPPAGQAQAHSKNREISRNPLSDKLSGTYSTPASTSPPYLALSTPCSVSLQFSPPPKTSGFRSKCETTLNKWNRYVPNFLGSFSNLAIFITYVALYLSYSSWIHTTKYISIAPTMMVCVVLLAKWCSSLLLYFSLDGTLVSLIRCLVGNWRHLVWYIVPAVAYATTDSLSVYCLRRLDSTTFAILYNFRIVSILVFYQHFMNVSLRRPHVIAILVIASSCFLKELPTLVANSFDGGSILQEVTTTDTPLRVSEVLSTAMSEAVAGADAVLPTLFPGVIRRRLLQPEFSEATKSVDLPDSHSVSDLVNPTFGDRLVPALVTLLMSNLTAFAAIYNERLLKSQSALPLNVQNMVLYVFGSIATVVFSVFLPLIRGGEAAAGATAALMDIGDWHKWKTILSYPMVIAVLLSAGYGIVTSLFIKKLNNLVREIACGLNIVATIPVNYLLFGYQVTFVSVLAVVGVLIGVGLYNRAPLVVEDSSGSRADPEEVVPIASQKDRENESR